METNIKVYSNFDTVSKISDILSSKGLVTLDLLHLPFNSFSFISEIETSDIDEVKLRETFAYVDEGKFREILAQVKQSLRTAHDVKVDIEGNIMLLDDTVCRLRVEFNDPVISYDYSKDTIGSNIKEATMEVISNFAKENIEVDPSKKTLIEKAIINQLNGVVSFLMYAQLPKEYKEPIDIAPRTKLDVSTSKKKNKKKVTYIKNTVIRPRVDEEKYSSFMSNRTFTRHTEAWYQKGFWRTYKSGKTIWINPIIKKAKGLVTDVVNQVYKVK